MEKGGMTNKRWREYFIRSKLVYDISTQIEYQPRTSKEVTADVNQTKLLNLVGTGVAVALGNIEKMSFELNTIGM